MTTFQKNDHFSKKKNNRTMVAQDVLTHLSSSVAVDRDTLASFHSLSAPAPPPTTRPRLLAAHHATGAK
jgi:hypothetical protein